MDRGWVQNLPVPEHIVSAAPHQLILAPPQIRGPTRLLPPCYRPLPPSFSSQAAGATPRRRKRRCDRRDAKQQISGGAGCDSLQLLPGPPQPFSSWPCTLSPHRRYVAGSPPPSICRRGPPELVVRVLPAAFDIADSRQPRMVERITAGSARWHRSPGAGLAATRRRRPP